MGGASPSEAGVLDEAEAVVPPMIRKSWARVESMEPSVVAGAWLAGLACTGDDDIEELGALVVSVAVVHGAGVGIAEEGAAGSAIS